MPCSFSPPLRSLPLALLPSGRSCRSGYLGPLLGSEHPRANLCALATALGAVRGLARGSSISPVAIRPTMMAAPITSPGRFSPFGPLGIKPPLPHRRRDPGLADRLRDAPQNHRQNQGRKIIAGPQETPCSCVPRRRPRDTHRLRWRHAAGEPPFGADLPFRPYQQVARMSAAICGSWGNDEGPGCRDAHPGYALMSASQLKRPNIAPPRNDAMGQNRK